MWITRRLPVLHRIRSISQKTRLTNTRAQARRLREKLESYLNDHPDFSLKKMQISGSLAKGTALRSLNDIDVACYVSGADTTSDISKLLEYIAEKLRDRISKLFS